MPIDWNDIKNWVKDTTKIAIKEAEDLTTKGKLKMEIFSLSRQKEQLLVILGNLVLERHRRQMSIIIDEEFTGLTEKIDKLDEKISLKKNALSKQK